MYCYNINEIQSIHETVRKGHFFSERTMEFFKTKVSSDVLVDKETSRTFFFTSDKTPWGRMFRAWEFIPETGEISPVGERRRTKESCKALVLKRLEIQKMFPGMGDPDVDMFETYQDREETEKALSVFNTRAGFHGVEAIPYRLNGKIYECRYANTGDTYGTTLLHDSRTGKYRIGSWGNFIKSMEKRGASFEVSNDEYLYLGKH